MEVEYVTIEREYGSGGTEIAAKLSDRCKIACYGAEIMELAAKELHISVAQAQQYEEKITSSFLYSASSKIAILLAILIIPLEKHSQAEAITFINFS